MLARGTGFKITIVPLPIVFEFIITPIIIFKDALHFSSTRHCDTITTIVQPYSRLEIPIWNERRLLTNTHTDTHTHAHSS